MIDRIAALSVATLAASLATDSSGLRAQYPTFRTRAEVVSVNVSVKQGSRPVNGLTVRDVELFDNGVRQAIDSVSREEVPVDVTMVLTGWRANAAAEHVRGLLVASTLQSLLAPADRLRVVRIGDDVSGFLAGPDYAVPTEHDSPKQIPGLSLVDGIFYALAWPVEPDRRHLVVAFTDGYETWSTLEPRRLPALAERSDAVFHAVFWSTPQANRGISGARLRGWEDSYQAIRTAVERTGGTSRAASRAPDAFAAILEDFRSSYLLRYTPRGVAGPGWHEIAVKITRPGSYVVRARKGYEGG